MHNSTNQESSYKFPRSTSKRKESKSKKIPAQARKIIEFFEQDFSRSAKSKLAYKNEERR